MRRRLALATILAVLVSGAMVASMAAAGQPSSSSALRPWGRGLAAAATDPATTEATPAGATRLVVIAREVDFTVIDVGPQGDSPGDQILFTDNLFDQTGRRIGRDQARCVLMFRDDLLCDASFIIAGKGQLIIHGASRATFAVTGGTGDFNKARGQVQESFLPTGEFKFVFTLYL
jgi:hypothetical protein